MGSHHGRVKGRSEILASFEELLRKLSKRLIFAVKKGSGGSDDDQPATLNAVFKPCMPVGERAELEGRLEPLFLWGP